jgi:hypothetical protein
MNEWLDFEDVNCNAKGECEEHRETVIQSSGVYHVPGTH